MDNRNLISEALLHADDTKQVRIGTGTLAELVQEYRLCFGEQLVKIIADPTTFRIAGQQVYDLLKNAGISVESPFIFDSAEIHAEMKHISLLKDVFSTTNAVPIAVGSGTINDLVKYTSSLFKRPYMIVGTAASMDGYTSFGASIEYNACKQTFNCPAPMAVLLDMDIVSKAPQNMSASGYADLIAKIPAAADWMLADAIATEPIDPIAWNLVQKSLRYWLKNPQGVARGEDAAIKSLAEGLVMSGLAMQKAKSSRTASGAEHQFSHLWDNEKHQYLGKTPSHGFKVGIGTICTSALYEKVLAFNKSTFDMAIANLPTYYQSWERWELLIESSFHDNGLKETVRKQCQMKFTEQEETRRRLLLFRDRWDELQPRLSEQLLPATVVQRMLHECSAPSDPDDIGIDRKRLLESYGKARLLRYRYNVLDLIFDMGLWNNCVCGLFEPGGFWYR